MKTHQQSDRISQILLEFEKYDKLHHGFILEVENALYDLILKRPNGVFQNLNSKNIKAFAIALINLCYEVIEKDNNYPEYRIAIEFENQDKALKKLPKVNLDEYDNLVWIAREKLLEFFPQLYDLSADGFRLFERISKYQVKLFIIEMSA